MSQKIDVFMFIMLCVIGFTVTLLAVGQQKELVTSKITRKEEKTWFTYVPPVNGLILHHDYIFHLRNGDERIVSAKTFEQYRVGQTYTYWRHK